MPVEGSCHCGNVRIELPSLPAWVADCNCSLCRRTAWRTAYYSPADVHISGETVAYVWGDYMIGIHLFPVYGWGTHWQTLGEDFGKIGCGSGRKSNSVDFRPAIESVAKIYIAGGPDRTDRDPSLTLTFQKITGSCLPHSGSRFRSRFTMFGGKRGGVLQRQPSTELATLPSCTLLVITDV